MSNLLTLLALVTIVTALTFVPELVAKARERWPGVFETDNPIPDRMPESWMIYFIISLIAIIFVGVWYGIGAGLLVLFVALILGLSLMHVVPYVRHQYRRMRGRTPPPLKC